MSVCRGHVKLPPETEKRLDNKELFEKIKQSMKSLEFLVHGIFEGDFDDEDRSRLIDSAAFEAEYISIFIKKYQI